MISDKKSQTKKSLVILGLIIVSGSASAGLYINDSDSLNSLNQSNSGDKSVSQSIMKKNTKQKPSPGYLMNDTQTDTNEVIFGGQDTSDYHVIQLGAPDISDVKVLDGFANEVSLLIALKQIVPEGWKATKENNIDLQQVVSWGGNRPWTYVLSDLAEKNNFKAQIDWNKKVVKVMKTNSGKTQSVDNNNNKTDKTAGDLTEVVGANDARRDWEGSSFKSKETKVKEKVVNDSIDNWVLNSDLTLRQNIEEWADKAGWSVSWGAVDYPVVTQTTLHGDFAKEGGPLHQIVMAYRDSEQPIAIKTHSGNKVVRVTNIKYNTPSHQRGTRGTIKGLKERR